MMQPARDNFERLCHDGPKAQENSVTNNATVSSFNSEDRFARFHFVDLAKGDSIEVGLADGSKVTITRVGAYRSEAKQTFGLTLASTNPGGPSIDKSQSTRERGVSVRIDVGRKLVVFAHGQATASLTVKSIRRITSPARS